MSNRIRLTLLLLLYCFVFWIDPDAMGPLVLVVPFFTLPAGAPSIPHFAAWTGWAGIAITLIAYKERTPKKLTLAARIALLISASLFVACSSPVYFAALTAIPFAAVMFWPQRKPGVPDKALRATSTPPSN